MLYKYSSYIYITCYLFNLNFAFVEYFIYIFSFIHQLIKFFFEFRVLSVFAICLSFLLMH